MSILLNSQCLKLQEWLCLYIQGLVVVIVRTAVTCASRNGVTFRQGTRAQYTADVCFIWEGGVYEA